MGVDSSEDKSVMRVLLHGELPQRWHGGERLLYERIMQEITGG